ncbi:MAG: group 1 glycosyl transferase [Acidithiobacillales bacterium SM23_46]|nr:MAG: group 1 glycosyl transferase [Thiotrichales bacterium SG8_50]KPK74095.1 MAG: group 1 glycosyl transferase [Acidithiobacillales bacterium SM23_46]
MRLLYLMTEPFGIGGVQSDILTLSEDLTARGHEVYVATTDGVLLEELKSKGARHVDIDFHYRGPSGFVRAARALRGAIRRHAIELVAPQSVRSTIAAYIALRLLPVGYRVAAHGRRVPIITTIHNIHNPFHFRYAGRILQRCADFVIFESHYERNRLLASGLQESKSEVIHSGIDTDRFVVRPPDPELLGRYGLDAARHRVFGIVARLSEEKGHVYLVEAFTRVHRDDPDARLLIIGDGPLLDSIRQEVKARGISDVVVFTGMQRNVPEHLALLNVFVLSSTRESFPLAAREAMAAGRAVVAPRIGGCPEVVDEGVTGYLFPSRDVSALAEAMRLMVADGRYRGMGEAARSRVERLFSRRSWVDGDERVYLSWLRA